MRNRSASTVMIALALLAAALPVAAPSASAQDDWVCGAYDQSAKRDRSPEPDGDGKVFPVVTIHGITGSDEDFDGTIDKSYVGATPEPPRTLLDALAGPASGDLPPGLTGARVFSFSYTLDSQRWVDHEAVGQRFAETIDCLYDQYGVPVSVVAHSMGGLVTRWVANTEDADGVARSTKLGKVLTLGTPYAGSDLSSLANGATDALADVAGPVVAMLNFLCGARGTATGEDGCGPIPQYASLRSEAGRNLRVGSPQLAALRPWPAEVDVTTLAGSQLVPLNLLGSQLNTSVDLGDIVVSTSSATADPTAGRVFTCSYDSAAGTARTTFEQILGLADPVERRSKLTGAFLASPCYHSGLMRYVELTNEVLGQLTDWLTANRAEPQAPDCPTPRLGSWGGEWRSERNADAGGTLDAVFEIDSGQVTGTLGVEGSTSVPGGDITGSVECELVDFGRVDTLVDFTGEIGQDGATITGTFQASAAAGGDYGTFELSVAATRATGGGPDSVEELVAALEAAWTAGRFDSMAEFASPSAVAVAREAGQISRLDLVELSSCVGGSSGVGWCEVLVDTGDGGYALIYSFEFVERGPEALMISELQFQGDAG